MADLSHLEVSDLPLGIEVMGRHPKLAATIKPKEEKLPLFQGT
jgi:hypothetical protein